MLPPVGAIDPRAVTTTVVQAASGTPVQAAPLAGEPAALAGLIAPPQVVTGLLVTDAPVAPATPQVKSEELLASVLATST